MAKAVEDRFWSKVDRSGGPDACWIWTAACDKDGYGQFSVGGKLVKAHRFAWELANGPIPDGEGYHGTCALHRCDNPGCVNPAHIFLGTQADNMADRESKGHNGPRLHTERMARGERHGQAKLTAAQVQEIRVLYAAGAETKAGLGRRFGVSDVTIGLIIRGRIWKVSK